MKKILVAEDEQNIREFVVINLERAGYFAVEAETGDQALELYAQDPEGFDVAVLDIMMPGSHDGLAVCKELRRKNPSIGIILCAEKNHVDVELSLDGMDKPIGVADYRLIIPQEDLKQVIQNEIQAYDDEKQKVQE